MKAALFGIFALALVTMIAADDGFITVQNNGGYVATFSVKYYLNGQENIEESQNFSLGDSKKIRIPDGATNVHLTCEEYWFPGQKTTVFTKSFNGPQNKCFKLYGTTLNPSYDEISC